ncbi:peptidylprolyl isomerase FKBP-type [Thermodesulfatator indicus DSM 15286]|uniref:Peptidyl-prolyl cis-trans isomerase n=1 Tax=Thermodesulfatator indicus (strain DSM 15286 / JCM 11887 / CIR29812) TaxID=667014 RepID=F8AD53_THEID|nr:peptidylprolyl isomerase [Thermodesulfatator indicus]AEH44785.1 peptidylprolyl isomerase FKBP-type [Thermodesulfatator indicus DSM 15286]
MRKVKLGDVVSIHCVGKLANGEVFESTEGGPPFQFQVGSPEIIPGLSEAVIGMAEGEEKEITLSPDKAFGERDERLVKVVPKDALSLDTEPQVGMMLNLVFNTEQGEVTVPATITNIDEENLTLDLNPPLAGETVTFYIKVVEIENGESPIITP